MIIKKIALGNKDESYIESNLTDGLNIISSDDNNKGKTIVVQSLMYALGNEPTFPVTFEYRYYYHYVEFEVNANLYKICRYNDTFVLKTKNSLMIFDNTSELKRYWSKNIFPLPSIIKNQMTRIVDPVLFFQVFFIGQDKKDTSSISHAGYYNKSDFISMLFDMCGLSDLELNQDEIDKTKKELYKLKEEKSLILKQHKILKSTKAPISYLSANSDRESFSKKVSDMEKINDKISEFRKARNAAATRKAKWETTVKELRSLNRTMDCGELRCMDCNSTNISFSASKQSSYAFDVSTAEMRGEIISSIQEKIAAYDEEIEKLSAQITEQQSLLQGIMTDDSISLESIVAYKRDIFNASDAEKRLNEIEELISRKEALLKNSENASQDTKEKRNLLFQSILTYMNQYYKEIDENGNLVFDALFTKKDEVYSGSESTIFHLVKLLSLRKVLNHSYTIVVDSFRAEDLSTAKEAKVIDLCKGVTNQMILTTTLKAEELGKYDDIVEAHHIDYTSHEPYKLLGTADNSDFVGLLSQLSINLM
ncbi:MAG: hypothetical protein PHT58_01835 [Eubacteriales bacterium]|nr:hypothetical protein [Eubacteriales bacterium]